MLKFIATLENNSRFLTVFENDILLDSYSRTFGDFLEEHPTEALDKLHDLVVLAQSGKYIPENPDIPDWGINDKNLWLRNDKFNHQVAMYNEYIEEYSSDEGEPVLMDYDVFLALIRFWKFFMSEIQINREFWNNKQLEFVIE